MGVKEKYSRLIQLAKDSNVRNLDVNEENNVLYIAGTTTADTKDKIWNLYNQIDPDMRSADLVMNIDVEGGERVESAVGGDETYEIQPGDSLSKIAGKYSGLTWQKIYDANKDVIKDPDKVFPGQRIRIPKA